MNLQARIFPTYFTAQTGLALLTAATYPSGSFIGLASERVDLALLGVTFGTSLLNVILFGPKTSQAMTKRKEIGIDLALI